MTSVAILIDEISHNFGELQEKPVPDLDPKRHSLTLWEMYKRTHSMSLAQGELTTPEAFSEPSSPETTRQRANKTNKTKEGL